MSLQELRKQAIKLSMSERLELLKAIIESIERELKPRPPIPEDIVERMMGLAKTDAPPPTDAEVKAMLEERLVEKYLK
jgi:hypothetical protein